MLEHPHTGRKPFYHWMNVTFSNAGPSRPRDDVAERSRHSGGRYARLIATVVRAGGHRGEDLAPDWPRAV